LEGVRAAIIERSQAKDQSEPFDKITWVFGKSDEPIDRLKHDLECVRNALARNPHDSAGPTADKTSFRRSSNAAKGPGRKHASDEKKTILRESRLPHSPEQIAAKMMVVSLSAPCKRPKSVRISQEEDDFRYHEHDYEPLKLVNVESQDSFVTVEGRCGLRFPRELEEASAEPLFRHSYPAYSPLPNLERKKNGAKQLEVRSKREDLDRTSSSGPAGLQPYGWRSQTPSRFGFGHDLVGQMAYYTHQVPSKLRPKHGVKKLSRDELFKPADGRRLWEHHHLSQTHGTLGPPSRHVQTRAGRVVEEAKERAMMLMSPRGNWGVHDSAGAVQTLPGLVLSPVDAKPLQGCEPYPIFFTAGLSNPKDLPTWTARQRSSEDYSANIEDEDGEARQVIVAALIRDGLIPKPKDSNVSQPYLCMSAEELKKKTKEERDRIFEKMCQRVEASSIASTMRWGSHSQAHARLEDIRSSPHRRQSLENFVKELPTLKRKENASYYKQNMIAKNRNCVSQMSSENERERKRETEHRSQSVPLTLERERERQREQQKLFEESERRRNLLFNVLEDKQRTKEEREAQEAHERALAEHDEYQRALRIREKSERLREREFSQPFLTALVVILFAIRLSPKARKLVPKKKTNVKYVVRIQRWWRMVLQYRNDPFHNKSLKDLLDQQTHEERILSRARHMIHMWQKAKHVAAIAQFLRELRDTRQDVVKAANAKYAAARVIQRCARAFNLSRKTSFMVWEMQWIRFERARNRKLIKQWKSAWQATMYEISQLVKVVPGDKKRQSNSNKSSSNSSAKWVGKIMDDFITNLPEEVKNIVDVPADIRRYLLGRHKIRLIEELVLRLDEHGRVVAQMRANRKVRDELCGTFPHLGEMDLRSPELSFLTGVDNEPPVPHLPLALKQNDLLDMILFAQKITRGKEKRPTSPPEERVLKTIPRHLEHMRMNGISLDDDKSSGEAGGALTKYLGADRGLSKDLIQQCSPPHSPITKLPACAPD
jgi:hypothetical protein